MPRSPLRPNRPYLLPLLLLPLLLAAVAGLLWVPVAEAQDRTPENPSHYGRDYSSDTLSPEALAEMLWESCPDGDRPPCLVTDPKTESGWVHLIAAPAVHRKVAATLARLDAELASHRFRLDLARVDGGGALEMPTQLPASVRRSLDAYRAGLAGTGLVHLGTAHLTTENGTRSFLASSAGTFNILLDVKQRAGSPDGPVHVDLRLDHRGNEAGSIQGPVLTTSLGVERGETVLAGTTYARQDGDRLLLLVTLEE